MPALFDKNAHEMLYPHKDDRLFADGFPDWKNNACISMERGTSSPYIDGYLYGARHLVKEIIASRATCDIIIFPIVFMYRHHIELQLKDILRHILFLTDLDIPKDISKHPLGNHKLLPLWNEILPLLNVICKNAEWDMYRQAILDGVHNYLEQFSSLDEDSFSFRYPTTRKGKPSLPFDLQRINIRHFADTAERLVAFLEEISCGLSALQEMKSDMESHYR